MGIDVVTIDQIFNKHAFHKGDCEKPFAMVRSDFYQACESIEKHLHNELIMKYNSLLSRAMKKLGWEPIYSIEIIDEIRKELK